MPPDNLTLQRREVHVWCADLDRQEGLQPRMWQVLSPDERLRARRFKFENLQTRFIIGRGLLRSILGRYLALEPDRLQFQYTSYGKPELAAGPGDNLRFNLSHAGGCVLYAVTLDRRIGVDVEHIRPAPEDYREVAERFFAPNEVAAIRKLPAEAQTQAFFTCWTLKESYIKAVGMGLSMPLDQFEVSWEPGDTATLSVVAGAQGAVSQWSLRKLHPGPDYVAAICVEGRDWALQCWQWPDDQ
jgi:4'-phosphopantetheinyl transferase